jgi:predicted dehydrogenase
MRLGIVGFGSIGRRHVENARALGLSDILLVRSGRPGAGANPWGLRELPDIAALLTERPDAVIVATPTALHLPAAAACVEARVPVLVEKPLSHSREGTAELAAAARRYGSLLMPAHNLRFHPGIRAARQHLVAGAVGPPITSRFFVGQYLPNWKPDTDYRATYSADPELGGGVTLDLIHEIDLARWWSGPFARVGAWIGHVSALEIRTEDVAEILLERVGGGVATVHLDYLYHPYGRWCEVTGDRGTLRFDYVANRLTLATPNASEPLKLPVPPFARNDMYAGLLRHFLAAVRGDEAPELNLSDALGALEIALTAREAAAARRWLTLKPDEDP